MRLTKTDYANVVMVELLFTVTLFFTVMLFEENEGPVKAWREGNLI